MNKRNKIVAIIAVRMGSKRLPKKAIADIEGYTAIERVVNNLKPSKYIDEIIIATTTNDDDDPIEDIATRSNIPIFRGDEDNVVKRYIDAAKNFNAEIIVRVTGDCPLISYEIADYLILKHLEKGAEFTTMELQGPPIGTLSEIIELYSLKRLICQNIDLSLSEYMSFYFKNNPTFFSINIVPCPIEFTSPELRLTLDYQEDLDLFRNIFMNFNAGKDALPLAKTISYLKDHPEIAKINNKMPTKWRDDVELIKRLKIASKIKN